MIKHVFKDGGTADDISGRCIEIKRFTALYAVVRRINERGDKERYTSSRKKDYAP